MNNQLIKKINHISMMLLILLPVISCSNMVSKSSTITQRNDKVVWADDDSQIAMLILRFEEMPKGVFGGTTNKRNFKHKIVVQNPDGSEQHPVTKWRDYQSGQLFFMKQAGYFIVESLLADNARRFDKISENGDEILIIETPVNDHRPCQKSDDSAKSLPARVYRTIIPSPDGLLLAHIYSSKCGSVTVEFLHANSLNHFDEQTMAIDEPMSAMWHIEGYIILTTNNKNKAWKVTPLTSPLPINPPKCVSPVTTSSEVSNEGQMVYFTEDKIDTKNVGLQKVFGCQ